MGLARPMLAYGSAPLSNKRLKVVENQALRMAIDASHYIRNADIDYDIQQKTS